MAFLAQTPKVGKPPIRKSSKKRVECRLPQNAIRAGAGSPTYFHWKATRTVSDLIEPFLIVAHSRLFEE